MYPHLTDRGVKSRHTRILKKLKMALRKLEDDSPMKSTCQTIRKQMKMMTPKINWSRPPKTQTIKLTNKFEPFSLTPFPFLFPPFLEIIYQMDLRIIQWNLNGFNTRFEFLQILQRDHNPNILCMQETNFKGSSYSRLKNFTTVFKNRSNVHRPSGGVAIYIHNEIHYDKIDLNTEMEATAIKILSDIELCIFNIYIPNWVDLDLQKLSDLIKQLPKPFIIAGDFNSHNTLWGSQRTNGRGKILHEILNDPDILLLNNTQSTYFNITNGSFSAIDLSLCSASIGHRLKWEVLEDLYDSDHFPILMEIPSLNPNNFNQEPKWKICKADWKVYQEFMEKTVDTLIEPSDENRNKVDNIVQSFINLITKAADLSIPKTSTGLHKHEVPWWNEEVEKSIKDKKHAFNVFKKHKTIENKIEMKKMRARARWKCKQNRRNSWRDYLSSLKYNTPSATSWGKINKIQGSSTSPKINALVKEDETIISDPIDMANEIADSFAKNSSDSNYNSKFLEHKMENDNTEQTIDHNNYSRINTPIKLKEIKSTLKQCKNTSPGPDKIPNIFLKNLPENGLTYLLKIYNLIWKSGVFPAKWSEAIVIRIPKPGKDKRKPDNYRPIALTCTMCKLMEKIVNKRLRWYLESKNFFDPNQSGFRQNRSTLDPLINLETNICDALIQNQHLLTVCLDLEKAYEIVWRNRVIQVLSNNNIGGCTLSFIKNFFLHRYIQVRVNRQLSRKTELKNGVPQGSVLSVTLFLVAFNDVDKCFTNPVKSSKFADDITMYCKGKDLETTEQLMQESLTALQKWSETTGFKFSPTKTKCIPFSRGQKQSKKPELYLNEQELPVTQTVKILGLSLDDKLTWKPHINQLKDDCKHRLNIIKTLA